MSSNTQEKPGTVGWWFSPANPDLDVEGWVEVRLIGLDNQIGDVRSKAFQDIRDFRAARQELFPSELSSEQQTSQFRSDYHRAYSRGATTSTEIPTRERSPAAEPTRTDSGGSGSYVTIPSTPPVVPQEQNAKKAADGAHKSSSSRPRTVDAGPSKCNSNRSPVVGDAPKPSSSSSSPADAGPSKCSSTRSPVAETAAPSIPGPSSRHHENDDPVKSTFISNSSRWFIPNSRRDILNIHHQSEPAHLAQSAQPAPLAEPLPTAASPHTRSPYPSPSNVYALPAPSWLSEPQPPPFVNKYVLPTGAFDFGRYWVQSHISDSQRLAAQQQTGSAQTRYANYRLPALRSRAPYVPYVVRRGEPPLSEEVPLSEEAQRARHELEQLGLQRGIHALQQQQRWAQWNERFERERGIRALQHESDQQNEWYALFPAERTERAVAPEAGASAGAGSAKAGAEAKRTPDMEKLRSARKEIETDYGRLSKEIENWTVPNSAEGDGMKRVRREWMEKGLWTRWKAVCEEEGVDPCLVIRELEENLDEGKGKGKEREL